MSFWGMRHLSPPFLVTSCSFAKIEIKFGSYNSNVCHGNPVNGQKNQFIYVFD